MNQVPHHFASHRVPAGRWVLAICTAGALLVAPCLPGAAEEPSRVGGFFKLLIDAARNKADEVRSTALATYIAAPRQGTCADRRAQILSVLPDAIRFSHYTRDIYSDGHDDEMAARNLRTMNISPGRQAYRDPVGKYYAEVRSNEKAPQVVIVFRGTRVTAAGDIYTNFASYLGAPTRYYRWAADLAATVAAEHPGASIVATGESLGGGLTLYAVLRNPGVTGFAFNPAGLSHAVWQEAGPTDRTRANAAITVISTRNATQIEPITGLSLAGTSVLPGHVFVVSSTVANERALHGANAVVSALEDLAATQAGGSACDGNIGILPQ
jgi:hypothetical protein